MMVWATWLDSIISETENKLMENKMWHDPFMNDISRVAK